MKQKFNTTSAIAYCNENHVNMLRSDINFLEEDAVFTLYHIKEEMKMAYLKDSVEDSEKNFIDPVDLQIRETKVVWLDVSYVTIITDK